MVVLYRGYPLNGMFVVEEWDGDGTLIDLHAFHARDSLSSRRDV